MRSFAAKMGTEPVFRDPLAVGAGCMLWSSWTMLVVALLLLALLVFVLLRSVGLLLPPFLLLLLLLGAALFLLRLRIFSARALVLPPPSCCPGCCPWAGLSSCCCAKVGGTTPSVSAQRCLSVLGSSWIHPVSKLHGPNACAVFFDPFSCRKRDGEGPQPDFLSRQPFLLLNKLPPGLVVERNCRVATPHRLRLLLNEAQEIGP